MGRGRATTRLRGIPRRALRHARVRCVDDRGRRVLAPGGPHRGHGRAAASAGRPSSATRAVGARRSIRPSNSPNASSRSWASAAGLSGFEAPPTPEEAAIFDEYERVEAAEPFDPDALTDFEVQVWLDGPGQPADRVPTPTREAFRAMARPLNEPDLVKGRRVALEPPANDRLKDLRSPVLAIAGNLDFSDPTETARHLEASAPDARALIWPDVAHMVGMEQPARLANAIGEFLAPLDRWA